MNIRYDPRAIERIQSFLRTMPKGTVKVALEAIGEYFLGTGQSGLRHYPAYKHVTLRGAYGGFKSEKQRRFVMAAIKDGRIDPGYPHRTGQTQRGWYKETLRGGYGLEIGNDAPGAYYTMSDEGQARLPALVGWRKVSAIVQSNMAGAMRSARAAVGKFLKKM